MYNTFSIVIFFFFKQQRWLPYANDQGFAIIQNSTSSAIIQTVILKSSFLLFKISVLESSSCSWCTWPGSFCQPHGCWPDFAQRNTPVSRSLFCSHTSSSTLSANAPAPLLGHPISYTAKLYLFIPLQMRYFLQSTKYPQKFLFLVTVRSGYETYNSRITMYFITYSCISFYLKGCSTYPKHLTLRTRPARPTKIDAHLPTGVNSIIFSSSWVYMLE